MSDLSANIPLHQGGETQPSSNTNSVFLTEDALPSQMCRKDDVAFAFLTQEAQERSGNANVNSPISHTVETNVDFESPILLPSYSDVAPTPTSISPPCNSLPFHSEGIKKNSQLTSSSFSSSISRETDLVPITQLPSFSISSTSPQPRRPPTLSPSLELTSVHQPLLNCSFGVTAGFMSDRQDSSSGSSLPFSTLSTGSDSLLLSQEMICTSSSFSDSQQSQSTSQEPQSVSTIPIDSNSPDDNTLPTPNTTDTSPDLLLETSPVISSPVKGKQTHICSVCPSSPPFLGNKAYNLHLRRPIHLKNMEQSLMVPNIEDLSREQLILLVQKLQAEKEQDKKKCDDLATALAEAVNKTASTTSIEMEPVKLSEKTLKGDVLDLVRDIGCFNESKGKTVTNPTTKIKNWPLYELQDYWHYYKQKNFEKKTKLRKETTMPEWKESAANNNSSLNTKKVPETQTPASSPATLPPSTLIDISKESFRYIDINDRSLRKSEKHGVYQLKSHLGRIVQVAVMMEPNQKMTPKLFANPTFQTAICRFFELLYNSPKTISNYFKDMRSMWAFLKTTPRFKPMESDISHFQLELKAKISTQQAVGNSRLQNITENGKIISGKMLDPQQWILVGQTVGATLNQLKNIPVKDLTQYDITKYKYFLWTALQYLSGGHRPQLLIVRLEHIRLVNKEIFLTVTSSKTGNHTPEIKIQYPANLFLWHWVSKVLPEHYPGNIFLWPNNTHQIGSNPEMDTNDIKDMFRIVLKSIIPWKTITNYTVRTYQGTHTKEKGWAQAMFSSVPIQNKHYDISNKVDEFYKCVEGVNKESGFLEAVVTGMKSAKNTTSNNNDSIDDTVDCTSTSTTSVQSMDQYLQENEHIETVTEIHKYRYDPNGTMNFLCTVNIYNPSTKETTTKSKIFLDRDLISYSELVNKYWEKITPPIKFPWESIQKRRKTKNNNKSPQKNKSPRWDSESDSPTINSGKEEISDSSEEEKSQNYSDEEEEENIEEEEKESQHYSDEEEEEKSFEKEELQLDENEILTDDEEFEVEQILSQRVLKGEVQYKIRWKGYDSKFDSWEPESCLSCPDLLADYNKG